MRLWWRGLWVLRGGAVVSVRGFSRGGRASASTDLVRREKWGVWEWRGRYWADEQWDGEHLGVLDAAFELIHRERQILRDYMEEDGVAMDTTCVRQFLSGTSDWYGQAHITPMDSEELIAAYAEGSDDTDGYSMVRGRTLGMGSTTIELSKQLVRASANMRKPGTAAGACGEGDGDCSCIVADLASLLIHEAAHVCLQDETGANALGSYFNWRFKDDHGWDSEYCCGSEWDDWNPAAHTEAEGDALGLHLSVFKANRVDSGTGEVLSSEWQLSGGETGCSGFNE